jgi:hypothetical protein
MDSSRSAKYALARGWDDCYSGRQYGLLEWGLFLDHWPLGAKPNWNFWPFFGELGSGTFGNQPNSGKNPATLGKRSSPKF